jgi:zinc D-Ala-D-Ala carboxypeptidase
MFSMGKNTKTWQWLAVGSGALFLIGFINRQRIMANLNVQFTPNFNLQEFITTATGLENVPGPVEIENLRLLAVNLLQPAHNAIQRKYPGKKVVWKISSGFRSDLVNTAIGGSKTSQHRKGQASDNSVFVDGTKLSNQELIDVIRAERLPYDQIIDEKLKGKEWVHMSYSAVSNRKEWLTARDGATGGTAYSMVKVG